MKIEKLNIKNQDLLEAIYEMEVLNGKARLTDVASKLNFSKSRASQEVNKLKNIKLVVKERYGPLRLTEFGKFEAERIVFKHKIIKYYLMLFLNIDEKIAEKDACAIEHIASEEMIKEIFEKVKKVTNSIWNFNLREAEVYFFKTKFLNELKINQKAEILKVQNNNIESLLKKCKKINRKIIKFIGMDSSGEILEFSINNCKIFLKIKDSKKIIVRLL